MNGISAENTSAAVDERRYEQGQSVSSSVLNDSSSGDDGDDSVEEESDGSGSYTNSTCDGDSSDETAELQSTSLSTTESDITTAHSFDDVDVIDEYEIAEESSGINEGATKLESANEVDDQSLRRRSKIRQCPWRSATCPETNYTYYWHVKTRESRWEKPAQLSSYEELRRSLSRVPGSSDMEQSHKTVIDSIVDDFNPEKGDFKIFRAIGRTATVNAAVMLTAATGGAAGAVGYVTGGAFTAKRLSDGVSNQDDKEVAKSIAVFGAATGASIAGQAAAGALMIGVVGASLPVAAGVAFGVGCASGITAGAFSEFTVDSVMERVRDKPWFGMKTDRASKREVLDRTYSDGELESKSSARGGDLQSPQRNSSCARGTN